MKRRNRLREQSWWWWPLGTCAAAADKMFSRSHRGEKCFCTNLPLRRLSSSSDSWSCWTTTRRWWSRRGDSAEGGGGGGPVGTFYAQSPFPGSTASDPIRSNLAKRCWDFVRRSATAHPIVRQGKKFKDDIRLFLWWSLVPGGEGIFCGCGLWREQ